LAHSKSVGAKYGPNIILKGIDSSNSNMQARAVVLHGWGSPMDSYSLGMEDYNSDTGAYEPPHDVVERIMNTDFKNASTLDMEKVLQSTFSSIAMSPYLNGTEGCLGVSEINIKHLDRKGRDKTQLELLREDLPGSLIFNYSGPQMESKFF
jgi:hypothetical protein